MARPTNAQDMPCQTCRNLVPAKSGRVVITRTVRLTYCVACYKAMVAAQPSIRLLGLLGRMGQHGPA